MTRPFLLTLFAMIVVAMLGVTIYASLEESLVDAGARLVADRWFCATLADAYFGFVTFYVWVAYRERTAGGRLLWFVLIMALGNIAMATYMLLRLWQWDQRRGAAALLLRSGHEVARAPVASSA